MSAAGSRWRVLVHKRATGKSYAPSISIQPNHSKPDESPYSQTITLPGTHFDELVIGNWIHLEQMSASVWWMSIGGVAVHVTADRSGNPTQVSVDGPGDYDGPVDGCEYRCTWTMEETP